VIIEGVRHRLGFAVRVDDHFAGTPVREPLAVALDTGEQPVRSADRAGVRHADGTYRFINLTPGPRQLVITSPTMTAFTWTASTPIAVPVADPRLPVVVEMWPTPLASAPPGVIAIRGALVTAPAGQEVRIEPVDTPPLGRRTRCDADGEFLFIVAGWTTVTVDGRIRLTVAVPGRVVTAVDLIEGSTTTNVPGAQFEVPPGRELRARIHLL
jgi:hypothetical protein